MDLPIYLDNHATTPVDPRVVDAMLPYLREHFGNAASRSHSFGMVANAAVERARGLVAALIGASPKEIIWTSGGTEADNLAIFGVAEACREPGHIVTTNFEHKAVLDPCRYLEKKGWQVTYLPVSREGLVTVAQVEAALQPNTRLVSVMAVNNEIGTVQPFRAIGELCRSRGIPFHSDASQAVGKIPVDVVADHIDLLTIASHKIYGPKGVGALYVRRGRPRLALAPQIHGGGHERGLRSGTLAVPNIVALGKAAELCREELDAGGLAEIARLRDRLWEGLCANIDDCWINGSTEHRSPQNLHVGFKGVESQALMMAMREVAVSSGSACSSANLEASHVMKAIREPDELSDAAIRFGIGRFNTEEQIDYVVGKVTESVARLRALNPLLE
ncbi:MAG: aminotransferase class V-fold PLP-dependent enzyme [Deltaproteobacteria bacterium]|nr:MAG: aminotransferase class V-fold PLP-dependent enzyme [Deltaproteobacteria bacterium]